ncbi:SAM-dependent methyltransferase [Actinoplanes sp. NPDC049265]|uniref:SAM-dependent methyltransferase n=1 Tax=Actinoplanes sp. NPDC049265 TaxID=3363902 RepID=UPI00371F4000
MEPRARTVYSRAVSLDTGIPHSARIWNYWLQGKDNFESDRAAGEQILALVPDLVTSARADREFLARAVEFLAGEAGIRQFLDIGTGLPTANNTHEVAQNVAPDTRVVYVDNDPLVLAHARALLTSTDEGASDYIDADLRDPRTILDAAAGTLDFTRPVAVMLLGILNFIIGDDEAQTILRQLVDAMPAGSYLVVSHPTTEVHGEAMTEAVRLWNSTGGAEMRLRDQAGVRAFFAGLELLEPGVVTCSRWRPRATGGVTEDVSHFAGVARKN